MGDIGARQLYKETQQDEAVAEKATDLFDEIMSATGDKKQSVHTNGDMPGVRPNLILTNERYEDD